MASVLSTIASESLDASPVAITLTDLSGRIEHSNRAFQKLFGLSPAIEISHPDVTAVCIGCSDLQFLDALARDGKPRQLEVTLRSPAGRIRRLLCSGARVNGEGGMPKWLSLSFIELSLSESAAAMRDSKSVDTVLVEKLATAGSWRIPLEFPQDLRRNPMKWSPALCMFLNTSPNELDRDVQQYLNAVHQDDQARVLTAMRATISSNVDYIVEYRRADISRIIRSRGTLIRGGSAGMPLVLAGIDEDVTQEYQRDQQQRRESLLLRSIVDSSESPVYAVDRQLCFVAFNRAYLNAQSDADRREIAVGADVLSSIGDTSRRKQVAENLRRALKGERRVEDVRAAPGCSETNSRREVVYSPMLGLSHEVVGVAVFSRDIQEVARASSAPVRTWRRQDWLEPRQAAVALSLVRK
jgi:PAS domain-containing protein